MFLTHASQRTHRISGGEITMSIARSIGELDDAFGLVYRSYVRAGLDSPNPTKRRMTQHHFLPTTDVILAKNAGVPIATASIVMDGELGLPAQSVYARELNELSGKGLRLAEVGSLADRRESPARFIQLFRHLSVLIAQYARHHGCNGLVAATHPRHARFYTKQIGFEPFGEIRSCPYAQGNPAVALLLDFEDHRKRDTPIYHHLFDHRYPEAELQPHVWDEATHRHFGELQRKSKLPTATRTDPAANSTAPPVNPTTRSDSDGIGGYPPTTSSSS